MHTLIKSFSILLLAITIQATVLAQSADSLHLKETNHNFGKIPQGRPVFHEFEVINAGKQPLVISEVQASCGCTTPEWSRDPIEPGKSSKIIVGYNSAAAGDFSKIVTVLYGSKRQNLVISGNVYPGPATSAPLNTSISLLKKLN